MRLLEQFGYKQRFSVAVVELSQNRLRKIDTIAASNFRPFPERRQPFGIPPECLPCVPQDTPSIALATPQRSLVLHDLHLDRTFRRVLLISRFLGLRPPRLSLSRPGRIVVRICILRDPQIQGDRERIFVGVNMPEPAKPGGPVRGGARGKTGVEEEYLGGVTFEQKAVYMHLVRNVMCASARDAIAASTCCGALQDSQNCVNPRERLGGRGMCSAERVPGKDITAKPRKFIDSGISAFACTSKAP